MEPGMTEDLTTVEQGRATSAAERRESLIELVVTTLESEHSRRAYRTGLEQFFAWWEATDPTAPFARELGLNPTLLSPGAICQPVC
jgi:hypothetical protein